MKRYLVAAVVLVLGLLICSGISLAQEEEAEELECTWGPVSSVSSDQIVISEYDYDKDEEVDVAYAVDPNVELINVDSLESITVGDSVDIEYAVRGDQKVAKVITVEKPSEAEELEEYAPLETYEEELGNPSEETEY